MGILMTSQYPALYKSENNQEYRNIYIQKLSSIGFSEINAEKMFEFELEVVSRHIKPYLLDPLYTKKWLFGLEQPFFIHYPCINP